MAKEISGYLKLQIRGGAASPAPPVGATLGSKGLNIMDFCKQFNARTQDKQGQLLPVKVTIYTDKSFDFIRKIIHDIRQSDTPEIFGEALLLMYPTKSAEDLVQLPGTELLEMFTQGLVDNKFLALVKFCELLGYD